MNHDTPAVTGERPLLVSNEETKKRPVSSSQKAGRHAACFPVTNYELRDILIKLCLTACQHKIGGRTTQRAL